MQCVVHVENNELGSERGEANIEARRDGRVDVDRLIGCRLRSDPVLKLQLMRRASMLILRPRCRAVAPKCRSGLTQSWSKSRSPVPHHTRARLCGAC